MFRSENLRENIKPYKTHFIFSEDLRKTRINESNIFLHTYWLMFSKSQKKSTQKYKQLV